MWKPTVSTYQGCAYCSSKNIGTTRLKNERLQVQKMYMFCSI